MIWIEYTINDEFSLEEVYAVLRISGSGDTCHTLRTNVVAGPQVHVWMKFIEKGNHYYYWGIVK